MKPFDEETQTWLFVISSLTLAFTVILLAIIYYGYGIRITDLLPGCVFYKKYHLFCPGCGGTRAVLYLLQGNILKSFFYHPFVLYAVVTFSVFFFSNILYSMSVIRWRYLLRPVHFIAAVIIIILQCLVKNAWILLIRL